MSELAGIIRARIRKDGPITFEAFMDMALYHPGLGYYTSDRTEIGIRGDFYTSPHLHPVFGAMAGKTAEEMWIAMGRPVTFIIVEMGGGRGYLAHDLLHYLKGREIWNALSYALIERNPSMAEIQKTLLREFPGIVRWHRDTAAIENIHGLVLSNELVDAFPVHLIQMRDGLKEVYVTLEGDAFVETLGPPSTPEIARYLDAHSIVLSEGYRTEVNLRIRDWLSECGRMLSRGFLLTIDYGHTASEYYDEERDRGTLMCYFRHTLHEDPFINVGVQDITAHVNFSALKSWGDDIGFQVMGYARQGAFLVSAGIDEVINELLIGRPDYAREIAKVRGLIMPDGMGASHHVMVQTKGLSCPSLRGFGLKNRYMDL